VIDFSPFLSFIKTKQLFLPKILNHFLTIIISFSFLIVSCSSTKRFPTNETVTVNPSSVRVLLDEAESVYYLTIQSPVYIFQGSDKIAFVKPGNTIECISDKNEVKLIIQDQTYKAGAFLIQSPEANEVVIFNDKGYKGELKLIDLDGSVGIVNNLNIEDYVKGVVAKEMPVGKNSENFEALKAFAICVRTYSFNKISEGKNLYDLFDDTRDQVYGGLNAEHPLSNEAVEKTNNTILKFDGKPAAIFYHSTCGGQTEAAQNIFTNKQVPYMMGEEDGNEPYCNISPKYEWQEVYYSADLLQRLKRASLIGTVEYTIEDIFVESKFNSGRVSELVFELVDGKGNDKRVSIFGNRIRSVLRTANGKNILWSTFFDVTFNGDNLEINGKGFGHGVGLCQWGAISLSRKGWNYSDILQHYFPGIEVESLND
jgi:stage II sporulation protein D